MTTNRLGRRARVRGGSAVLLGVMLSVLAIVSVGVSCSSSSGPRDKNWGSDIGRDASPSTGGAGGASSGGSGAEDGTGGSGASGGEDGAPGTGGTTSASTGGNGGIAGAASTSGGAGGGT